MKDREQGHKTARRVLEVEAQAILDLRERLDEGFDRAVNILARATGRTVVTGIGKSGIIAQKVSATLASTGTPSLFLHPTEALHGDLGRVVKGDVMLAISYSGDTEEILALLPAVQRLGCPVLAITGNPRSPLARSADVHLDASIRQEACPLGLAPTASTTAALALGDALAMTLMEHKGLTADDFANFHPGGHLGRKLLRVEDIMHAGAQVPRVGPHTPMKDVLFEMTSKRLGMTTVVGAHDRLEGIISDGDLRRQMERFGATLMEHEAAECMTREPVTIGPRAFASQALALMESRRITSLVVVVVNATGVAETGANETGGVLGNETGKVLGVVHLHDLWATEEP